MQYTRHNSKSREAADSNIISLTIHTIYVSIKSHTNLYEFPIPLEGLAAVRFWHRHPQVSHLVRVSRHGFRKMRIKTGVGIVLMWSPSKTERNEKKVPSNSACIRLRYIMGKTT